MRKPSQLQSLAAGVSVAAALLAATTSAASPASEAALVKRVDALEKELSHQKDIEDVRRLQFIYNYYNSQGLTKQLIDLVAPDAESIEIGGQGVYKGKAGFIRLFSQYDKDKKIEDRTIPFGRVLFQIAGQEVIDISPDGKHAWARVRVWTPVFTKIAGSDEGSVKFNGGDYEQEFAKENGKWMLWKFKYVHDFAVNLTKNGTVVPGYSTAPTGREDAPTTWYHPWPETGVLKFHYPNPVTGQMPPDTTGPEHYWVGNWPGEFGQTGHK